MRRWVLVVLASVVATGCAQQPQPEPAEAEVESAAPTGPYVLVLGTAQDAGYPQMGCRKDCCRRAWADPRERRHPTSLAIVDPASAERWLIEATPELREQLRLLNREAPAADSALPDGIVVTHAHIGHYTGLMQLGREVMGTRGVPLYAMPRMTEYLRDNGPWSQLVELGNIELRELAVGRPLRLNQRLELTPFLVPHRDEYSETIGLLLRGPERSVLFIPDIDKWQRWERPLAEELAAVDLAFVDGTFYRNGELPGRDMSEIPHPFIEETLALLGELPAAERAKIRFIHMNHTNPALDPEGAARSEIRQRGFGVAEQGERYPL